MDNYNFCLNFELSIGESPVWDDVRQGVWLVDILGPRIYFYHDDTAEIATFVMPEPVASLGLVDDGRLIVALTTAVHLFDPATLDLSLFATVEADQPENRLNDGKVGPDGRFYVGSMHDRRPRRSTAALYRVSGDGTVAKLRNDLQVSNGLAWSGDGKTLYHADSSLGEIRQFGFDPVLGEISDCRLFGKTDSDTGLPDGAAVDTHGNYWSAGVTSGTINKFAPDGTLVEAVRVPLEAPTMVCFGGPDLKTVFVTSLSGVRDGVPHKGGMIRFRSEVAGVPVARFKL